MPQTKGAVPGNGKTLQDEDKGLGVLAEVISLPGAQRDSPVRASATRATAEHPALTLAMTPQAAHVAVTATSLSF